MSLVSTIKQFFSRGSKDANPFVDVPILDNFYQTCSFYPMPIVLISTVSENGKTNLGTYSLCFPYYVVGNHAMLLISRSSSNTSHNIQRTKRATINFVPDGKEILEGCVELGFPGETTEEKMKRSIFHLIPSSRSTANDGEIYPDIVDEAIQVFECTWDDSHPHDIDGSAFHFVLSIDKIVMKSKWKNALKDGSHKFPPMPIDFGFRDCVHFWFSPFQQPYSIDIPRRKGIDAQADKFMGERIKPGLKWDIKAAEKLVHIPRIFMKRALTQIAEEAEQRGESYITPELLEEIRAKHKH